MTSMIIWFFTWPLLIFVSYYLVKYTLRKYEDKFSDDKEIKPEDLES